MVDGTITGDNAASNALWTSTDAFTTYGSTSNTWGNTLTRDQVNSSDFGVAIAAEYSGFAGVLLSAEIDYIMMQISYTPVLVPLIVGDFKTKISENKTNE